MAKQLKTVVTVRPEEFSAATDGDSVRSWLACIAGAFILTFVTGCHASFGVVLPQLLNEFNVSKTQAGKNYWAYSVVFRLCSLGRRGKPTLSPRCLKVEPRRQDRSLVSVVLLAL